MKADTIHFKGYRCFKDHWVGFDEIKPVNVIIGRNNTGKSHLLELVQAMCKSTLKNNDWKYLCSGILSEKELKKVFREDTSDGDLQGKHWRDHGTAFVNKQITWQFDINLNPIEISFLDFDHSSPYGSESTKARIEYISSILNNITTTLSDTQYQRLFADRDIRQEPKNIEMKLDSDGSGATNIIRQFILSSNSKYEREVVQIQLLGV